MTRERIQCPTCGKYAPEDIQVTTSFLNKRGRKELAPWEPGCLIWNVLAIGGVVAFFFASWSLYSRVVALIPSVLILLFTLFLWVRLSKLTRTHSYYCKGCGKRWKDG